jgi:hypothetical protein
MRQGWATIALVCCFLTTGCQAGGQRGSEGATFDVRILAIWSAPTDDWHYGAEGQKLPRTWPTFAVVLEQEPEHVGGPSNTVLAFASGPDLRVDDPPSHLLAHVRHVTPCAGSDFGMWAHLVRAPHFEPQFLFIDEPGGTAGARLRIFGQSVTYDNADYSFQSHSFGAFFEDRSRHGIYVGDVDGEGHPEVLLPTPESNSTGVPRLLLYRVLTFVDGTPLEIGQLGAAEVLTKAQEGVLRQVVP